MGKGKSDSSPLLRPDSDAVSLHSQHGYVDANDGAAGSSSSSSHGGNAPVSTAVGRDPHALLDDADMDLNDLPPLYSDVVADGIGHDAGAGAGIGGPNLAPLNDAATLSGPPQRWRYEIGHFDNSDKGAQDLLEAVAAWAKVPPRPYARLRGTHKQTVDRNGKKEKTDIVDFDVRVELTPYLFGDRHANESWRQSWVTLQTALHTQKVRRGTVFRCEEPVVDETSVAAVASAAAAAAASTDTPAYSDDPSAAEQAHRMPPSEGFGVRTAHSASDDELGLATWCRRYCSDPAPLRAFQMERRMVGFDYDRVRPKLEALVASTNYRGHLQITFPVDEVGLVYYSDHPFNRWRLSRWIQALCVLTLTILFTWPYLFFRTHRYEVVTVNWRFSRIRDDRVQYISISEDQWYNLWARAIAKAVLSGRQATLSAEDLRLAEGAEPTFSTTDNSVVNSALGIFRASVNAMNNVNREMGWGMDT